MFLFRRFTIIRKYSQIPFFITPLTFRANYSIFNTSQKNTREMANMDGQNVIVTGSNTGIGYEIARGLATLNATVILACRNEEKAKEAVQRMISSTGNKNIDYIVVDISSQKSIRNFVDVYKTKYGNRLKVLINNGSIAATAKEISVDGFEMTFSTNVLGYHLLTNLLLDALKNDIPSRIVHVASRYAGGLLLDDINFEKRPFDGNEAYRNSKQAERMLTYALARRLESAGVTVNVCHPGVIKTKLLSDLGFSSSSTPEQGAKTPIYLAINPKVAKITGQFFSDKEVCPCQFQKNLDEQEKLWNFCEKLTKKEENAAL